MSIYSFHNQTLLVLNEIYGMLKDMDVDVKDIVKKSLDGLRKDLESMAKIEENLLKSGAISNLPPLGAFSTEEIEDLDTSEED